MKKIIAIVCIVTVMFALAGCNTKQPKEPGALKSFSYSFASDGGSTKYTLTPDSENRLCLQVENTGKQLYNTAVVISEKDIETLETILKENNVPGWNGFEKKRENVYDGFGFDLNIQYENTSVTASGYEMYPENFQDTHKLLVEYFKGLQSTYCT